jgi:LPXTG-motif cell wall-anchored protein
LIPHPLVGRWKDVNKQVLILMIFILGWVTMAPLSMSANENEENIELSLILPTGEVFDVKNMRPSYAVTKTLQIQNSGKINFEYSMMAKKHNGSEELFNHLLLSVTTESGENLFNGKLNKFKNLEPRYLAKSGTEKLVFRIELPPEAGNEFQGLQTKVIYIFSAKQSLDHNTGGILPTTGETNPWLFYISGIAMALIGVTILTLKSMILGRELK